MARVGAGKCLCAVATRMEFVLITQLGRQRPHYLAILMQKFLASGKERDSLLTSVFSGLGNLVWIFNMLLKMHFSVERR